jgi:hypothetical protein
MGLRSPQELQQVQAAPERSTRLQGGQAPQINPQFINTLDQAVDSREAARRKAEEAAYGFAKDASLVEAERIRLETQGKLASKRGSDALVETPKLREDMLRRLDQVVSKAPAQFRDRLAQEVKPSIEMKFNSNAIPYQYSQVKELKDTVQKNRLVQIRDEVVENSSDIERMSGQSVNQLWNKSIEYGKSIYGEDMNADIGGGITAGEAIESLARKTGSDALAGAAIHQAVMLGSIDRAKEILTRFDLEILPADKEKAFKAIRKAESDAENGIAINLANTLLGEFGDNVAAMEAQARVAVDGNQKLYSNVMAIINSSKGAEKKTRDLNRQKTVGAAIQAIDGNTPLERVLPTLDPEDREKVSRYAVDKSMGKLIVTDQNVYNQLMSRVTEDPDILVNGEVNLQALKPSLNQQDYKTFERMQMQLSKEQSSEQRRLANQGIREGLDVVTRFNNENRVFAPDAISKNQRFASDYVNDLIDANPKITPAQLRLKLQQALYDRGVREVPVQSTWQDVRSAFGFERAKTKEFIQPEVRIKPDVRSRIENLIRQRNQPMTEATIKAYADELQKQKFDVYE